MKLTIQLFKIKKLNEHQDIVEDLTIFLGFAILTILVADFVTRTLNSLFDIFRERKKRSVLKEEYSTLVNRTVLVETSSQDGDPDHSGNRFQTFLWENKDKCVVQKIVIGQDALKYYRKALTLEFYKRSGEINPPNFLSRHLISFLQGDLTLQRIDRNLRKTDKCLNQVSKRILTFMTFKEHSAYVSFYHKFVKKTDTVILSDLRLELESSLIVYGHLHFRDINWMNMSPSKLSSRLLRPLYNLIAIFLIVFVTSPLSVLQFISSKTSIYNNLERAFLSHLPFQFLVRTYLPSLFVLLINTLLVLLLIVLS